MSRAITREAIAAGIGRKKLGCDGISTLSLGDGSCPESGTPVYVVRTLGKSYELPGQLGIGGTGGSASSIVTIGGPVMRVCPSADADLTNARSIAVDPHDALCIFVGTVDHGICRSLDGGATWRRVAPADIPGPDGFGGSVIAIAVDPTDSNIVWCAVNGHGIFKSLDRGCSWSRTSNVYNAFPSPTSDTQVNDLFVSTANHDFVFAATTDGVYRTIDGGATWTRQVAGESGDKTIYHLAYIGASYLYAARAAYFSASSDNAGTWSETATPAGGMISIAVDPTAYLTLYAGDNSLFDVSADGGASWTQPGPGLDFLPSRLWVDPHATSHIFAARYIPTGGLYLSPDASLTWDSVSGLSCWDMAFDPVAAGVCYFVNNTGIHKSTDGGVTWSLIAR